MSDKLKDVIAKLKKTEPKAEEPKEAPAEVKKEELKPVSDVEKNQMIGIRIAQLQDNGIYRLELLSQLAELNKNVQLLTATIMDLAGVKLE